jgi:hypothetical protein
MVVLLPWPGAVLLLVVALGVALLVTRGRGLRDGHVYHPDRDVVVAEMLSRERQETGAGIRRLKWARGPGSPRPGAGAGGVGRRPGVRRRLPLRAGPGGAGTEHGTTRPPPGPTAAEAWHFFRRRSQSTSSAPRCGATFRANPLSSHPSRAIRPFRSAGRMPLSRGGAPG